MKLSMELTESARKFNKKYSCAFDFASFDARVEEFTFLRPNNGWCDVYKVEFDRLYKQALEMLAMGSLQSLDGEAMLDDFEFTLIRPYLAEWREEIKHKPYVGMDHLTRLELLAHMTSKAPSGLAALYADKYKKGELTLSQMQAAVESEPRERSAEIAGYVQALESVNKSRGAMWRFLHPRIDRAEKQGASQMKQALVATGGEEFLRNATAAASKPFEAYRTAITSLAQRFSLALREPDPEKPTEAM